MYIQKTYYGNLNVGKEIVSLETDINYQAIEINYIGNLKPTFLLPNNYITKIGNNKIIILKLIKNNDIIKELFSYQGTAIINKCVLVSDNFAKYLLNINKSNLEHYIRLDGTWNNYTRNWEDLDFDGNNDKKSYIHKKTTYDNEARTYTTKKEIRKK